MTTDAPVRFKAGDPVHIDDDDTTIWVYVGPRGSMAEVGREGKTDLVAPERLRPTGEKPAPEGDTLFAGIVDQFDGLLKRLRADLDEYEARVQRRRAQIKRIEAVQRTLKGPQKRTSTGGRLACGHWPREKAHQTCMGKAP